MAVPHWTGGYLQTSFTGTTVKVKARNAVSFYASIDGGSYRSFSGVSGTVSLTSQPLSAGTHTLRIEYRSGDMVFEGLVLDSGAHTVAPSVPSTLLEFVGDSITAGFRTPRLALDTYGWKVGEMLHARHTLIARNGYCLVAQSGCVGQSSQFFDVDSTGSQPWDFSRYQATAVVVNLGTNDLGHNVSNAQFQAAYTTFLRNVRAKYPNADLFVMETFKGWYATQTKAAVSARNGAGDAKVFYVDTTGWLSSSDFADGTHPTAAGHTKIANRLAPIIAAKALASQPAASHAGVTAVPTATATATTTATGDSRSVSEPRLPGTVCKTLTAQLTMSNRTAGSSQESAPPDTSRIQSALNACTQSGSSPVAVKLVAGGSNNAFLSAPLTIPAGVALVVDSNVTLFASRNATNYQISGASSRCGTVASTSGGCKPFIAVSGANAGIEAVRASSGSQGRIDARGDLTILGTSTSWFQLASQAHSQGLKQNNPRMIQADRSNNFVLYNVDLLNAANFHVVYQNATGFTAWGVRIKTPATASNTDGIDPSGAVDVTIADSYIMDGDDGIAVKAGSVASRNITIKNNHFYGTHGISIGSETAAGLTNMLVENNTVTGIDANGAVGGSPIGLRIKSNSSTGGHVDQVSYLNNCVTQVRQPLVFDTHYAGATGSRTPYFTNILINGLRSTSTRSGGGSVISGYDSSHPIGLTLLNVAMDNTTATAQYATIGLYNSNLKPTGTGVTTSSVSGSGSVPSCSFPTYPAL